MTNLDRATVDGFGEEWERFDQTGLDPAELDRSFSAYFALFPWAELPSGAIGFDMGCGSGRWAKFVAPRVGTLHCIDPSDRALAVARHNLADQSNCVFHLASVDALPMADESMDFGYTLGVLHHVPDTASGIRACGKKLKRGAPLLVYLYYRFDQRPVWFRTLWRASDALRRVVSRLPHRIRHAVTDAVAASVYLPLARIARAAERRGRDVDAFPLSAYRNASFYAMRTDALDRFGTRLEHRFTRKEIASMLDESGFRNVRFSADPPYWCAVAWKA